MAEVYVDIIGRINKVQADINEVKKEMAGLQTKSEQVNQNVRKEFEGTGKVATQLSGMIAGIFSIGAVTAFIRKIVQLRSEWEKQTAVIKTLVGSQKEAEATMNMIKKVADASLSPLQEVSNAYIRLVNQGIKPTYDQMKKMVDVAVSSGRSFGQLAEAIFDATQGQIRGLRDFGIQSKLQGDKVQLSFRGMTQTIDLTAESMMNFVVKAGELKGVAGASEEIGKTMTGAIDNIGDSVETLMLTLGELSSKTIVDAINNLTNLVNVINFLATGAEKADRGTAAFLINFLKNVNPILLLNKAQKLMYQELNDLINKNNEENEESVKVNEELKTGINDTGESLETFTKRIKELIAEMAKGMPNISIKEIMGLETINEVKSYQKAFQILIGTLSGDELSEANLKLYWLNQRLKELGEQGLAELTPDIILKKIDPIKAIVKSINDIIYPDSTELKEQKAEEIIIDEETWQTKLENAQKYFDTVAYLIDGLAAINTLAMNNELQRAEGNEKKQEEIRRKYAKKEQSMAVARTLISGAEGIVKTGSNLGYPVAIPFQILQGIETAIQIALIRAQRFATGILNLQGRGTGTSDSIPSMLSRGESVMTAKETQEYYPYLKAMKEGKFPKLQLELMNDFAKMKQITNNNLNYDNSREIQKLEQIRTILNKERGEVYIEGKYKVIKRNGITTKISLN